MERACSRSLESTGNLHYSYVIRDASEFKLLLFPWRSGGKELITVISCFTGMVLLSAMWPYVCSWKHQFVASHTAAVKSRLVWALRNMDVAYPKCLNVKIFFNESVWEFSYTEELCMFFFDVMLYYCFMFCIIIISIIITCTSSVYDFLWDFTFYSFGKKLIG